MRAREAVLVLEDGSVFRGRGFGSEGEAFGEAVFNTAMSGYQEVLTDPSYAGQVVAMTYPHQGNYGVNDHDAESSRPQVAALAVREASRRPSSWRSQRSLPAELERGGIVGIEGIDTRRLTLAVRAGGAMRCAVSTRDLDPASLLERVRSSVGMEGADLARRVSTPEPYAARDVVGAPARDAGRVLRVAAYDFGMKRNILRMLAASGCEVTVVPAATPADRILGGQFDGVFLSNGPGDPSATTYGVEAVRALLGRIPLFGICLGHQLLALALGFGTYKMKFGHRGVNQPVLDRDTGRVEITSHNHGFAVDPVPSNGTAQPGAASATPAPSAAVTSDGPASGTTQPEARAPEGGPMEQLERRRKEPQASPLELREWGGPRGATASGGSAGGAAPVVEVEGGAVALTHWNLNDGTLEGLRCLGVPAFSVQYHPEAAPGPHDSRHLFARFRSLMEKARA